MEEENDKIKSFFKEHLDIDSNDSFEDDWALMERKLDAAGLGESPLHLNRKKIVRISLLVGLFSFILGVLIGTSVYHYFYYPDASKAKSNLHEVYDTKEQDIINTHQNTFNNKKDKLKSDNTTSSQEDEYFLKGKNNQLMNKTDSDQKRPIFNNSALLENESGFNYIEEENETIDNSNIQIRKTALNNNSVVLNSIQLKKQCLKNSETKLLLTTLNTIPTLEPTVEKQKKFNRFYLGVAYSPDANRTALDLSAGVSNRIGMLASYYLWKRLSVTTGVFYNNKKYAADGESYAQFTDGMVAENIDASCSVIDIPIMLSYHHPINKKLNLFFSGGVNHFTLLDESYQFEFNYPDTEFNRAWNTTEDNTEGFSALNASIGAEYIFKKGNKFRIETYVRAPLKKIGWGNVDLYGNGLMFSYHIPLNFNR